MSSIVKGTIAAVSGVRELRSGDPVITVTVYDNQPPTQGRGRIRRRRHTKYEIAFTRAMAGRVADSFRTGDAVLVEAEQLRTST